MPDMTPVDSSSIARIGYDPESQELFIEFIGGRTYAYSAVPESRAQALLDADSKGGYFNREIRPNHDFRET